jgi:two-component sensor histidine kinase
MGRALLFAAFCVFAATALRLLLSLVGPTLNFATYFPAVLIAALIGGRLCGLLAIGLSIIAAWWAFMNPPFQFSPLTPVMIANFSVFAVSSLLVVALAVLHRNVVLELERNELERKLLADEIRHRGRNVLAVVLGLVRQTVCDPVDAKRLTERISAAIDTEDILEDSSSEPMGLQGLLESAVQGPHQGRVSLEGPECIVPKKQARKLRLAFHEMTTNALKYGALSEVNGRIEIRWTLSDGALRIEWCEQDGPKVSGPAKANFGSKLIRSTHSQAGASMVSDFAQSGYRYTIVVPVEGVRR